MSTSVPKRCGVPPEGWECSREPGHHGPCAALPTDYHCNGYRHFYGGEYVNLFGHALCPEYPTCRSEAATKLAMEEENMEDYDLTGLVTTGRRLLEDPPVDQDEVQRITERILNSANYPTPIPEPEAVETPDVQVGTATGRMVCSGPNLSQNPTTPATSLSQTFSVLGDVAEERQRQEIKWGQQNHDDLMWSAILAEEVGEAAQEVLTQIWGKEAGHGHGNLREELVQVAAVAVAWIEAIDRRTE